MAGGARGHRSPPGRSAGARRALGAAGNHPPPSDGAARAIGRLRDRYRVVVHSSRCRTVEGRRAIERWLQRHGIQVDEVCEHKPPAMVYLDDRAVRFDGDWDEAIAAIHDFRR